MKTLANPNLSYLLDSIRTIVCPICGCKEYHKVYKGPVVRGKVDLTCVLCSSCTHLYLNPSPSLEAYSKFYNEDDYGKVALAVKKKSYSERSHIHDEEFFRQRTRHGTRLYETYLRDILTQNDVVFDFGAGDGAWLFGLREATGCKIDGNELMSLHVEFIRKRLGINVFHAPVEDMEDTIIKKHNGTVKLAIASDSLEHMTDPMKCLHIARSILAEDGYLYICNWDILRRMDRPTISGKLLRECLSIDHPHYFHKNSYLFMVEKAGFEVLNFEAVSSIRTKTNHMEIFARKTSIPEKLSPKPTAHQVLSEIASIESKIKRYRAFSLWYRLHSIKKTVVESTRAMGLTIETICESTKQQ